MPIVCSMNAILDFDGVIKDSVSVKSDAFETLFSVFGTEVSTKIRKHHDANGGMSRYDKFPLYLSWAGLIPIESLIEEYSNRFSSIVKQQVIDSKWVAGVEDFLKCYYNKQQMFIVTATPQSEIEDILSALEISSYFAEVIGSPTKKNNAISFLMSKYQLSAENTVMIGDSMPDYLAAFENSIEFVLRKTELNTKMQKTLQCKMIDDFIDFRLPEFVS